MKTAQIQSIENQPGNANFTSLAIPLDQAFGCSVQNIWQASSGIANGLIKIQCSLDYFQDEEGNVTNPGTWVDLIDAVFEVQSASGSFLYVMNAPQFLWARVVWQSLGAQNSTINSWTVVKGA